MWVPRPAATCAVDPCRRAGLGRTCALATCVRGRSADYGTGRRERCIGEACPPMNPRMEGVRNPVKVPNGRSCVEIAYTPHIWWYCRSKRVKRTPLRRPPVRRTTTTGWGGHRSDAPLRRRADRERESRWRERPCKPGPVLVPEGVSDSHFSGASVTTRLERPTRKAWTRAGAKKPSLFGLSPGGVYRAVPVTEDAGALLPHRFTLAARRADSTG